MRCIAIQELSRCAFQVSLQADDVVRGQELIQIATAPIKTRDAGATSELEGVIQGKLGKVFHLGKIWSQSAAEVGLMKVSCIPITGRAGKLDRVMHAAFR
jgi:hypothetical protein